MKNIDIFHDPGHARLKHLLTTFPKLAEYVGNDAEAFEKMAAEDLPDGAFADKANRLLPVHTPKMAALSNAYARVAMSLDNVKIPVQIQEILKIASSAYAVPEDVYVYYAPIVKEASADDYLFPDKKMYLVRDAEEVKTAEARLIDQKSKLLPINRVEAFGRLYKKAGELGVTLTPTSHKYAGLTATDSGRLRDLLRARAAAITSNDNVKTSFLKLAAAVHNDAVSLHKREIQIKLAHTINELDARAGLHKYYDKELPDPLETVFNTDKVASAGIDLGNGSVSMTKLMSLDPSFYGDALGEDFIPDITTGGQLDSTKLAEVLPTLPRDMKLSLMTALKNT